MLLYYIILYYIIVYCLHILATGISLMDNAFQLIIIMFNDIV